MDMIEKEEYIIGSISLISNKITLFGDTILQDITFKQWFLLLMISKMKIQDKNINSIAEFVGTTRQNTKKMLVSLESKGYVNIKKSKSDARALNVELTKKHIIILSKIMNLLFMRLINYFQRFLKLKLTILCMCLGCLKLTAEE